MIDNCWTRIGVRGDRSCPELERHIHCRNCPVYASAAVDVLRRTLPDDSLAERTNHFAQPKVREESAADSVVIFRVGSEWLALPTSVVKEVVHLRPVHSLPHRRSGTVLGVTNVRGELMTSVSLCLLLGLTSLPERTSDTSRHVYARLLVLRHDDVRVACPADDVYGVHRFQAATLKDVPATLAAASARYSKGLLPWNRSSVSVLDEQLLFYTLRRCVA
jgi:chemotaxis-related protein WspD